MKIDALWLARGVGKFLMPRHLIVSSVTLFFFVCTSAWAADRTPEELLFSVDTQLRYTDTDFSAEYSVVHDRPGKGRQTTVSAVFRRDADEQYVIIALEPAGRRGQGYLKQGPTLWIYDPESRRFNSTSSRGRFLNSNARASDFSQTHLSRDYSVVSTGTGSLGRFECTVLDLEAKGSQAATPHLRIWVDSDEHIRKIEDYSNSGQLMRTTAIPEYQVIEDRVVPSVLLIEDGLAGAVIDGVFIKERTLITVSQISFEKLADSVFSKNFLERAGR